MSSPRESIGVLRELPCSKNVSTSLFEPKLTRLKSNEIFFIEDDDHVNKNSSSFRFRYTQETLNMILGEKMKTKTKKKQSMTSKKLETRMSEYFKNKTVNDAVVENSSINKMLALVYLANGKELEACCQLISSHASCLRQQILYRNLKSKLRSQLIDEPMVNNLDPKDLDVDHRNTNTNPERLVSTLEELPSEWYVLQITAQHEHLKDMRLRMQSDEYMYSLRPMHGLHILALPTGRNAMNPICVTLPKPNSDSKYDIRIEIETLLNKNKSDLTAAYNNNDLYWKMRKKQNIQMNTAIKELENSWLREWRILLLSDYVEHLDLVEDINNMIDKLIADSSVKGISKRNRWLLKKVATGACYLESFEVERAVKYILPTQTKLAKNIILSIVAMTKAMDLLKTAKRKPLILILDECLDHISFESITLLKNQAVSRFPSLHIAYALFKQHKDTIENGYKIIQKSNNIGTFIVNPSIDLTKMEVRIKAFIEYWLPKWKGLYGTKPNLEYFKNSLTKHNILMYNGHGSGIQFLSGEEIEKMRVLASVLLFGCGSIKLLPVGGRLPAYGISNQYLMSCSPCILGMLWEVTDVDVDRMTAEFISNWISSPSKRAWSDINQSLWHQGLIEFNNEKNTKIKHENDMLVAVAESKDVCKHFMTSAAVIVRGLPVKLVN